MEKTLCFTGRRPKDLFGYDKDKYYPIVDKLELILEDFYLQGFKKYISGGAQGFDQLSFWAVNRLKKKYPDVKNIVYIPFLGQERNWNTTIFNKKEYKLMLSLADKVKNCSPYLEIDDAYKYEIVTALYRRNHDMVDDSSTIIGLYPSDLWMDERTKGGTAECLRYAKEKQKDIYQLNPFNLDFQHLTF